MQCAGIAFSQSLYEDDMCSVVEAVSGTPIPSLCIQKAIGNAALSQRLGFKQNYSKQPFAWMNLRLIHLRKVAQPRLSLPGF